VKALINAGNSGIFLKGLGLEECQSRLDTVSSRLGLDKLRSRLDDFFIVSKNLGLVSKLQTWYRTGL